MRPLAKDSDTEQKIRQEDDDEYDQRCQELWLQTQSGPPT
ncbi:hypothetical protein FRUB_08390 [Fimbriiglobus ruber]|uniref:Uncharacterized protein n=1 Tax=Fimbriiglobus ruber TaxID=1908690 RepID=A0A225DI83_9BACT|nr:hypothetical protein FRUB_08390 [Fimbriiglobus ruber]